MTQPVYLVTGAGGFIGSAVVRALVCGGERVLALVRPGGSLRRLSDLLDAPELEIAEFDLSELLDRAGIERAARLFSDWAPKAVLHAGWHGVRGASRQSPDQVDNVTATLGLLRAAARAGSRVFVGLGSQAEYGPSQEMLREDSPTRPATLYGTAKLAAGQLSLAVGGALGVRVAWVRVFSVYGPGEERGALVPDLISARGSGQPFALSSCEQPWDYLYVEDAAEALCRVLRDERAQGALNLASGFSPPLRRAVDIVTSLVPSSGRLEFAPRPTGELPSLRADIGRLAAVTGWSPRVTLEEGLRRTAEWLLRGSRQ